MTAYRWPAPSRQRSSISAFTTANQSIALITREFRRCFVSLFLLATKAYPAQNGVSFRAIASAGGFPDSISNVVGPFNLASPKARIGSTRLDFIGNGSIADLYFRATESAIVSGMSVRVQASITP